MSNLSFKHFQILPPQIENLLEKGLHSKVFGVGRSLFQTHWGDSKRNCGTYEVAHKKPYNHYLLKNQVNKVKVIIETAVTFGHIPADLISNLNSAEANL